MASLFEALEAKLRADPSLLRRSGPRQDLGLLLFAKREEFDRLWKAAERVLASEGLRDELDEASLIELRSAVDALRAIFGEEGEGGPETS